MLMKQVHQKSGIIVTLIYSFRFQPNVCNGCHDLLMSMSLCSIVVLNIKGLDYCCIISLNEAINLIQNADLTEKSGTV